MPNSPDHSRTGLKHFAPVFVSVVSVLSTVSIGRLIQQGTLSSVPVTAFAPLNAIATVQCVTFPVSFVVLGFMFLWDRAAFRTFFRLGDLAAPATGVHWMGIREDASWRSVGASFALMLTFGTALFMAGAVSRMGGGIDSRFRALFALAVLMAVTNAWSEEMTARLTIVAGLHGKVAPARINWISAAVFGPPHYFGMPAGLLGVLMAGFMGWLLAKSVQETRGLLWAWFLHFIQDVVIFTAVVVMVLKA